MKLSVVLNSIVLLCLVLLFSLWLVAITGVLWRFPISDLALGVLAVLLAFAVAARLIVLARDRGKAVRLAPWGVAACAAAATSWIGMMVWPTAQVGVEWTWLAVSALLTGVVGVVTFGSLLLLIRIRFRWMWWVRLVTLGVLVLLCACVTYTVYWGVYLEEIGYWQELEHFFDWAARLCGVLAILFVLCVVSLVAASNPFQSLGEPVAGAQRLSFNANCPRCGHRQMLRTDGDSCSACGLHIKVVAT
jgi:hypothetical protein